MNAKGSTPLLWSVCWMLLLLIPCVRSACKFKSAAQLTGWQREILDQHNLDRLRVSPAAFDMMCMVWDDVIAATAQAWADNCIWGQHSSYESRTSIPGWSYVGENMARGAAPDDGDGAHMMVSLWYNEVSDYTYDTQGCTEGAVCGHYTQEVWANSYALGCGYNACGGQHIWVCQYAPGGNWPTWPYAKTTGNTTSLIPPPAATECTCMGSATSLPTCSGFVQNNCKPGRLLKSNLATVSCAGAICLDTDCCENAPTCVNFNGTTCPYWSHLKADPGHTKCQAQTCTVYDCCEWEPCDLSLMFISGAPYEGMDGSFTRMVDDANGRPAWEKGDLHYWWDGVAWILTKETDPSICAGFSICYEDVPLPTMMLNCGVKVKCGSSNCVGHWEPGVCSTTCSEGVSIDTWVVDSPQWKDGKPCAYTNGTTRTRSCTLGTCPVPICAGSAPITHSMGYITSNPLGNDFYLPAQACALNITASDTQAIIIDFLELCTESPNDQLTVEHGDYYGWRTEKLKGCGKLAASVKSFLSFQTLANVAVMKWTTDSTVEFSGWLLRWHFVEVPVDCTGEWIASPCSKSCGNGTITSTFNITRPMQNKGFNCSYAQGATKTSVCNTILCTNPTCVTFNASLCGFGTIIRPNGGSYLCANATSGCKISECCLADPNMPTNNICDSGPLIAASGWLDEGYRGVPYALNMDCSRAVQCPLADQVLALSFVEFCIEKNYDLLYIYDGADNTRPRIVKLTQCNGSMPGPYKTSTNTAFLRFFSDYDVVKDGFTMFWNCTAAPQCQLPASLPAGYAYSGTGCSGSVTATQCSGVTCADGWVGTPSLACGAVNGNFAMSGCSNITNICKDKNSIGSFGILNEGYTGSNYVSNMDCQHLIQVAAGKVIRFNFTEFCTENRYDYLYIHDGPTIASPLLANLTGCNTSLPLPGPFQSQTNAVFLHFTSDDSGTMAGFTLTYNTTSAPQCSMPSTLPLGYVYDGVGCSGSVVQPACTGVSCDASKGYGGHPFLRCSTTGAQFSFTGCSFGLSLCDVGTITAPNGTLVDGLLHNGVPVSVNCSRLVTAPYGSTIVFTLSQFCTPSSSFDTLFIFDGPVATRSTAIANFTDSCSTSKKPFVQTNTNMAVVQFKSDGTDFTGPTTFSLDWKAGSSCILESNTDFGGNDVRSSTETSFQGCCAKCNSESDCACWTYDPASLGCYRKSSTAGRRVTANLISGYAGATMNCSGQWTSGACSTTCGNGVITDTFHVTVPAALGGLPCEAANLTTRSRTCNVGSCGTGTPLNCVGQWQAGQCSVTCGNGTITDSYQVTTAAVNGGMVCEALAGATRTRTCSLAACDVGQCSQTTPVTVKTDSNSWFMVPVDATTFDSYDVSGFQWTNKSTVLRTYFGLKGAGELQLNLQARVVSGSSILRASFLEQTKIVALSDLSLTTIWVGNITIATPGYYSLDIKGMNKTDPNQFALIDAVVLSGSAINCGVRFYDATTQTADGIATGRRGPKPMLTYEIPQGTNDIQWVYNELVVPKGRDPIGSHFGVIGFAQGHISLQRTSSSNDRRVVFYVSNPAAGGSVVLNSKGTNVVTDTTSGGGGEASLAFEWKPSTTYRFLVKAQMVSGDATMDFVGYFHDGVEWKFVASWRRPSTTGYLNGTFCRCGWFRTKQH